MKLNSLKENFEKWELFFTPFFLILVILMLYMSFPYLLPLENYNELFIVPSVLGIIIGLVLSYILDLKWKKIEEEKIMDFLRLPSLLLVLLAASATIFITIDYQISLILVAFGLGGMIGLISVASLTAFYRSYIKKER